MVQWVISDPIWIYFGRILKTYHWLYWYILSTTHTHTIMAIKTNDATRQSACLWKCESKSLKAVIINQSRYNSPIHTPSEREQCSILSAPRLLVDKATYTRIMGAKTFHMHNNMCVCVQKAPLGGKFYLKIPILM